MARAERFAPWSAPMLPGALDVGEPERRRFCQLSTQPMFPIAYESSCFSGS